LFKIQKVVRHLYLNLKKKQFEAQKLKNHNRVDIILTTTKN